MLSQSEVTHACCGVCLCCCVVYHVLYVLRVCLLLCVLCGVVVLLWFVFVCYCCVLCVVVDVLLLLWLCVLCVLVFCLQYICIHLLMLIYCHCASKPLWYRHCVVSATHALRIPCYKLIHACVLPICSTYALYCHCVSAYCCVTCPLLQFNTVCVRPRLTATTVL